MKKNFISILLIIIICMNLISTTSAENTREIIFSDADITQIVDSNHSVIRMLEKKSIVSNSKITNMDINYQEVKKMLANMGMDLGSIEMLSKDELEEYANSKKMKTISSYCRVDSDGIITYITKNEAIQKAYEINQMLETSRNFGIVSDAFRDSYMHIYYGVTDLGNGNFKFVTQARWLTMPLFRGKDAVGGCAQNCTVTPGTQSGYYQFKRKIYMNGQLISEVGPSETKTNILSNEFQTASNNNFFGSAAIVNLPDDMVHVESSTIYEDYFVHTQYNGHVNNPGIETWFNSTGSYVHSKISFTSSPSLTIDINGVAGSIGLGLQFNEEIRSVLLEIHHTP